MTAPDLKPCPFCGGEASMKGGPVAQESFSVWCVNGHSMEGGFDAAALATGWNTRTTLLAEALAVPTEMGGGDVLALIDAEQYSDPLSRQEVFANGWNAALRAIGESGNG